MTKTIVNETPTENLVPEKVITIGLGKALSILAGSIIVSIGGSIWGTLTIANTLPVRVSAAEQQIMDMKKSFMPLDLSVEKWKNNDKQHEDIIKRLELLQSSVNSIK